MGMARLVLRLTAFIAFLAATVALATCLRLADRLTGKTIDRTPWARTCFRLACLCLGFRIRQHGTPAPTTALLVSNHISWSDIPILGSLAPIRFLSKAEVGQWPVIGWLARQAGTLFIRRGGGQVRQVKAQISANLEAGETVLVFPEGTTSPGLTVLPFHGLLLKAAVESGCPIQPITIAYRRAGRPDPLAPFINDDAFHTHLLRLLRQPPVHVDVVFHQPLSGSVGPTAPALAEQLRLRVLDGLSQVHAGQLDPPKEAEGDCVRTEGGPGRFRRPSLPGGQQSPDRSTG